MNFSTQVKTIKYMFIVNFQQNLISTNLINQVEF